MRFKDRKVLVAGGAGFVGSNLVQMLSAEQAHITVLDDLSASNYSLIADIPNTSFVQGSVTDFDLVDELVKGTNIVFNLAARNITTSTKQPREDFNVNAGGMLNILMAGRKHGIEKIVYASSASVYGNARYLPINEDDQLNILNPYAASKLSAENYCMAFHESYDVPVVILRYSNVYGINQSPGNMYCGVITKFITAVLRGRSPEIHGDGEQTRDFTFVGDAVEATMLAALAPNVVGEVMNVGTGKETTVKDLARRVIELSKRKIEPAHIDRRDIDNIRRRVLNIEKIRRKLRWIPATPLEEGLGITYAWQTRSLLTERETQAVGNVAG